MVSLVGIGGLNLRPLSHLTAATRVGRFLLGHQFLKVINCLVGLILLNDSAETEQEFKCSSCTANVLAKLQLETFFIFLSFLSEKNFVVGWPKPRTKKTTFGFFQSRNLRLRQSNSNRRKRDSRR